MLDSQGGYRAGMKGGEPCRLLADARTTDGGLLRRGLRVEHGLVFRPPAGLMMLNCDCAGVRVIRVL